MKAPSFQFYPADWQRDMDDFPLEIEGAWIRICCRLYWTGGTATKTLEEWGRILREKPKKTEQFLKFFQEKNICDLVNQNGSITITSRRIVRDEYIRNIRKLAGSKGGNPNMKQPKKEEILVNQNDEQNPTPSSSSSKEVSKDTLSKEDTFDDHIPPCPHEKIISLYHKYLPMGQQVTSWKGQRSTDLRTRWREDEDRQTVEWWEELFKDMAQSKFLTSRVPPSNGHRQFVIALDWIVKYKNFTNILEGKYHG